MNLKLTYGNIWNYHNQIQKQLMNDSVCAFFNATKIRQFYNDYGLRIETIRGEIKAVQEKYFTKGEDGVYETHLVKDKPQWKPKEGLTVLEYNAELETIMSREILN